MYNCTYINELYLCHTAVYVTDRRPPGSWKPANKRCPIILVILVAKMAISSHIIILYGMLKGYDPIQSITALTLGPIYRLSITFLINSPKNQVLRQDGYQNGRNEQWTSFTISGVGQVLPLNIVHCFQGRFHIHLGYEILSFLFLEQCFQSSLSNENGCTFFYINNFSIFPNTFFR